MAKKSKMSNGLILVTEYNKNVETVVVSVGVKVGARYETPQEEGLSHFLEHMLFKGTNTRTYEEINNTVDFVGASTNAYTSENETVYYIKTPREHVEMAFDILSDQVFNSIIPEEELKKEAEVVVQEIKRSKDDPESVLHNNFSSVAFKGNQLSRTILGTEEQILSYTRDDMMAFYKKHYVPNNMVVSVAGNMKHKDAVNLVVKYFNKKKDTNFKYKKPPKVTFSGGQTITHVDSEHQVNVDITFGFDGRNKTTKKMRNAIAMVNNILSSGMGSKLVTEIREKRGLVYSTGSYITIQDDYGYMSIYGGTDHHKIEEFIEASILVLKTFNDNVTEKDLQKAKNSRIAATKMSLESITNVSLGRIGEIFVHNKPLKLSEIVDSINEVSLDDVKEAMTYILSKDIVLSVYGMVPQHETLSVDNITKALNI